MTSGWVGGRCGFLLFLLMTKGDATDECGTRVRFPLVMWALLFAVAVTTYDGITATYPLTQGGEGPWFRAFAYGRLISISIEERERTLLILLRFYLVLSLFLFYLCNKRGR